MKFLRSRRGVIVACAALLLVLFLFRPGAGRLKNRIAGTIGQGLQRQVEIGSVHLRLLPTPGFDLEDFIVHDDPAFGAEPVLRAQEVTANLRLLALLRARLEVSQLSLTEPSLNLVRNDQGHWNIESILEHTAQTSAGPTGQRNSLTRPQFPYIQADRARINFKVGSEKKPFAFSDADFAFWQDSDSSWGMRLKAQPIRTDLNLSDTGILRASGTWRRAPHLRETPLQFTLQWEGAQLGQVTKLISTADRGWRGTVRAVVNLAGEPSDLKITSDASIQDFRRYDLAGGDPLRVGTHCEGRYSAVTHEFDDIRCLSPVGEGRVTLRGNIQQLASFSYALDISFDEVPLSGVLLAARHAKKDLPADLQATGSLSCRAMLRKQADLPGTVSIEGTGSTKDFKLQSASTKTSLVMGEVPLVFTTQPASNARAPKSLQGSRKATNAAANGQPSLIVGPLHASSMPGLTMRAIVTGQGYSVTSSGDADIKRLLLAARTFGIPTAPPVVEGTAKVDVALAGEWRGFAPPRATGTAQLRASRIELHALNGPIELTSGVIRLESDRVEVQSLAASFADSHWKGSLSLPRGCSRLTECLVTFDLQADEIVPERLHLFGDPTLPSPWYRVLGPSASSKSELLAQLHAHGQIRAARLVLPSLNATHVSSKVEIDGGRLRLSGLTADVFDGKHRGAWEIDFTAESPLYTGSGTFEQIALEQVASAMNDPWLTGTGSGEYRVEAHGHTLPELLGTASGNLKFDVRDGEFPHVIVEDSSLRFHGFTGTLLLRAGTFEVERAALDTAATTYSVNGSATWSRQLDFTLLSDGGPKVAVNGTLAAPTISASPMPSARATLPH